jgi:hypothetical protein
MPAGKLVSAQHADYILCSVGQEFSALGTVDPCKHPHMGKTDFQLAQQQCTYTLAGKGSALLAGSMMLQLMTAAGSALLY